MILILRRLVEWSPEPRLPPLDFTLQGSILYDILLL